MHKIPQLTKGRARILFNLCNTQKGFLGSSAGKESACNAGDPGSIPGSGRSPGEGHGNLLQYSYLENSMDRLWGCKVSDMSEQLTHKHTGYIASFAYADSSQY